MSEITSTRPYASMTDERLLDLLLIEEDRLPREAVDEFLSRADRVVEPLTRICQDEKAWKEEGPAFWRPIHATYILGALGGKRAVPGLIAALRHSNESEVDWVYDQMPYILGSVGGPAVEALEELILDRSADKIEREMALSALVSIAGRHPSERAGVLEFLRGLMNDTEQNFEIRRSAAFELLSFAQPEDREALTRWARREEDQPFPYFNRVSVHEAYANGGTDAPFHDWMTFYDADQIENRQERWRNELEGREGEDDATPPEELYEEAADDSGPAPIVTPPKVGRNEPCPCGGGKKYKRCCGR